MTYYTNKKQPITKRPKCFCGESMFLVRLDDRYGEEISTHWVCHNKDCKISVNHLIPDYK